MSTSRVMEGSEDMIHEIDCLHCIALHGVEVPYRFEHIGSKVVFALTYPMYFNEDQSHLQFIKTSLSLQFHFIEFR